MTAISIKNLTKTFGHHNAVEDLTLEIASGEFIALLGPSGCGKTTTMNMIAGLEQPTAGEILFDGEDVSRIPLHKRNIGFVFQNYAIFTHLTVRKNLAYGLEVRGLPRTEINRRVEAIADRMELTHRLNEIASRLSVNELQKLAIARSAVVEPRIFLLDEPLSNLDANFRAYMRAELKVLQREFGQTMVYVTHDQIEAMSLADRIVIINQGKLMQCGSPMEVYEHPANRFVANFVGSPRINLIDGELRESAGKLALIAEGGAEIPLSGRVLGDLTRSGAVSRSISVAVRPQDIYFGARRTDDDIRLRGDVETLERVGPKRLVHLRVNNTLVVAVDERDELTEGGEVDFFLSANRAMAFDIGSGNRLGEARA